PFANPDIVMPKGVKLTKRFTTFNGNNHRATLSFNDSFSDGLHLLNLYGVFDMYNAKNSNDTTHNYGVLFISGLLEGYSY
ncbi:hypothetical protein, partial [Capnocytophaga gingivalis]